MNDLTICPSLLIPGHSTYSPRACKLLFDGLKISHVLPYQSPEADGRPNDDRIHQLGRISLSGVQAKYSLKIDGKEMRLISEGESSLFILKPAPTSYHLFSRTFCPANEHLTMQIASQVYKIETASCGLCFYQNGDAAYFTRRFDRDATGNKWAQEDFASLGGFTRANGGSDYKYINSSYEECAQLIDQYTSAPAIEKLKFFKLVIFNYLFSNDDAHLKNFSLIDRGMNDYRLAPAYDLMNTALHLSQPRIFALDKGLFREGMQMSDVRGIKRADFEEFGRRIGLPNALIDRTLKQMTTPEAEVIDLTNRSFLSESLKRTYIDFFQYRRGRLVR